MAIQNTCHIIAVTGGKGGVGKSVFAANLAFNFLKEMRASTLLIDLDSKSCGDQSIITGLKPVKTVSEICNFKGVISSQNIKSILSFHSSGLAYMAAVSSPGGALKASEKNFSQQLYRLSKLFKFIIVDLGTDLGPLQLKAIEDSSSVLMVTTPEILVVNQTKKRLNDLVAEMVPMDLVHLVLNKVNKSSLSQQVIINNLKRPILASIPQDDFLADASLKNSTPFVLTKPNSPLSVSYHEIVRKLNGGLLQKSKSLLKPKRKTEASFKNKEESSLQGQRDFNSNEKDGFSLLKSQIHSELINEMDLKKDLTNLKGDKSKEEELRRKTQQVISGLTDKLCRNLSREERSRVIQEVLDEALGLGPLESLLEDKTVTEIMVNGHKNIYAEKSGKLVLTPVQFTSNLQLRNVIERIVTPLGRRIDEKSPYVDARLEDGSRVNAVVEPLAIDGPSVTIRKFPEERITIDDYTKKFGSLTTSMADFLKVCVEQGLNIIISGGTGSGKTTLLNVMSGFIPPKERIITVEDAAELQLKQEHVVRLETRPSNLEGEGEVSIRDLIKNSLRMRPDRIIVGECRDGAALDMLSAMNTGHDGSMTTVHANTPREAVSRLETLCMMAGMDLPQKAIREQIAGAIHLIIQIGRLSDGSRKIKSITEVVGMQSETVTLQEIFRFKEEGFDQSRKIIGQFQAMGLIPTFIEKFARRGVKVPRDLFTTNSLAQEKSSEVTKKSSSIHGLSRPSRHKKKGLAVDTFSKKASGDDQ